MPDFDAGFKIANHISGQAIARIGGIRTDSWSPIEGEMQTATRFADRAFLAADRGERFCVYMEAYTRWVKDAPWSLLAKSGVLSERERLPTRMLLFVLTPRGYKSQRGRFRLTSGGRTRQFISFREICLWKRKPEPWWDSEPGLMSLYPLFAHRDPHEQVVSHAAQAIQQSVRDTVSRADLLTTLAIFGKLAYPKIDVINLIGREQMRESKFFEEVMAEGRVEASRHAVLKVLQFRFGKSHFGDLEPQLQAVSDEDELTELLRVATTCRSVTQFQRAMKATTTAVK